jgi:ABC-2 type transport system permease protein
MIFFFYLLRTSLRASISKKEAFLIESCLMIANNLIFFSIWWIFFRQFNDIGGWEIQDMIVLMAIGTCSYGLMQICFGGIRNLSRMIIAGDLDPFMSQPKNLLLHIAGSKSFAKGWGHLMTGIILIVLGELYTPVNMLLIFFSILCGCLVFTSISIIAHSLPFWLGAVEGLSKKYCDALFLFALYPTNIYSGVMQLVMFTLIPAGIISYLPVELIRDFSSIKLFLLAGSSIAFIAIATTIFYCGLRKYESGNQFGMRL